MSGLFLTHHDLVTLSGTATAETCRGFRALHRDTFSLVSTILGSVAVTNEGIWMYDVYYIIISSYLEGLYWLYPNLWLCPNYGYI